MNTSLLSMTGFGRANAESEQTRVVCEVRTVNHRGLDIKFRIPTFLYAHENEFQKEIQANFTRGRIEVFMEVVPEEAHSRQLEFNERLASQIVSRLKAFQKKHDVIKAKISMGDLLGVREIFTLSDLSLPAKSAPVLARRVLALATKDALTARQEEGKHLQKIIESSLKECERLVKEISKRLVGTTKKHFKELMGRIKELTLEAEIDSSRLAQEVAYIVEKVDVSEEINRLGAHLAHFRDLCAPGGAAGRKLDFLCQEMFREANTASSKITDTNTTFLVVDLKAEIERIREQVQNIE